MGYRPVALEGEGCNPTSRTEKAIIKLANASLRNIYLGKKTKEKLANFASQ